MQVSTPVASVEARERPVPRYRGGRRDWAQRLSLEIPLLYEREELTVAEIAETENVTVETVVKYLPDTTATERRLHDVTVLRERKYVRGAIAERLGMSDRLVARYLRELA